MRSNQETDEGKLRRPGELLDKENPIQGATAPVAGRDLAAESMFMYGSRVGFWRLHRMFTRRNVPCTIFAVARALERNPEAVAAIREADWDVAGHGLQWEMHANLAPETEREHIRLATEIITNCMGRRPEGWYTRYAPSLFYASDFNRRRILLRQ